MQARKKIIGLWLEFLIFLLLHILGLDEKACAIADQDLAWLFMIFVFFINCLLLIMCLIATKVFYSERFIKTAAGLWAIISFLNLAIGLPSAFGIKSKNYQHDLSNNNIKTKISYKYLKKQKDLV